jgi:monoamine oxidase
LPEHPGGKALHGCAGAVYDPTVGMPGNSSDCKDSSRGGLLMAYFAPPTTEEITRLPTAKARLSRVLEHVATVAPEGVDVHAEFETGVVQCWREDESAGGVYANFAPGQYGYKEVLAQQHGCVSFAGEHTSLWCGYMNGAIESGHRVAWEVWEQKPWRH